MKYVVKKEDKFLCNILQGFDNKKSNPVFTDKEDFALIFYDKADANYQAKRFKCELVSI